MGSSTARVVPFRAQPNRINRQAWDELLKRRRLLNEVRSDLEGLEREWESELNALTASLVGGATIEDT